MRRLLMVRIGLVVGLFAALAGACAAQESFPYTASVIVNEAAVRSGPGEKYYSVDVLDRGANVEVYKNSSGWCAIRPPEGSYSWIPARQLRLDETGKIGEVVDPETYPMIGSNLPDRVKKHGWQVQLNVGERVAIVGEKRFIKSKEQISETWYKIEPPAGEFRWIEARFLSKPAAEPARLPEKNAIAASAIPVPPPPLAEETHRAAQASHTEGLREPAPLPSITARTPAPISLPSVASMGAASPGGGSSGVRRSKGFRDVTPGLETASFADSRVNEPAASRAAVNNSPNERVSFVEPFETGGTESSSSSFDSARTNAPASAAPQPLASGNFDDQLADVESQLALAVAQSPRDWNLSALRSRAKQLADMGPSPLDRGRARMLLERISLYESHQKQTLELEMSRSAKASETAAAPAAATTGAPWKPAEQEPKQQEEQASAAAEGADAQRESPEGASWIDRMSQAVGNGLKGTEPEKPTHFEAQGRVQKVRSNDPDVKYPPYALIDDAGTIVAFVGSPVVKLDKYVGKQIGVYGRRGLHEASRTTYIEVVELVDLEVTQRKPMRTTFGTIR